MSYFSLFLKKIYTAAKSDNKISMLSWAYTYLSIYSVCKFVVFVAVSG